MHWSLFFGLFLLGVFAFRFVLLLTLRKVFRIEKRERERLLQPINEKHQKAERYVKGIFFLLLIAAAYFIFFQGLSSLFAPLLFVLFTVAESLTKAFFEWKYSSEPKRAILTVADTVGFLLLLSVLVQFEFLKV